MAAPTAVVAAPMAATTAPPIEPSPVAVDGELGEGNTVVWPTLDGPSKAESTPAAAAASMVSAISAAAAAAVAAVSTAAAAAASVDAGLGSGALTQPPIALALTDTVCIGTHAMHDTRTWHT